MDSLKNTLILVFVSVPISTIIAILIAVALNSIKSLQKVFQTIFFLPYVTNTIAIGLVFSVLFSQPALPGLASPGLINTIFNSDTNWLNGTESNWMMVVLIYNIWSALPFKILVFIGGLQSISKQYYDAAKIDSTPSRRVFSRITIPLLSPMISYIVITSFIGTFKSYESVMAVAGDNGTLRSERWTVVAYVYDAIKGTETNPDGISYYSKGAAGAVVLFIIIMIFTVINMQISKRRVHY
jgi:multiple sugar transport system permease protein